VHGITTKGRPAIDNSLDLPFDYHFCPGSGTQRGAALVFTTDEDRQQLDVLAVLEADNADSHGGRASELAEFVAAALNAYVGAREGLAHWKRVHPLMAQMRDAGRQDEGGWSPDLGDDD
jgi:hypothetical protein